MANFLKNRESGQTLVEYLLLVAAASITAFLMISRGPLPRFTVRMIKEMRVAISNIVSLGDVGNGSEINGDTGQTAVKDPSSKERFKALHE